MAIIPQKQTENMMSNEQPQFIPPQKNEEPIPSDQEIVREALECSIHGDITNGALYLDFTTKDEEGNPKTSRNYYCISCLNTYLRKLQKAGEFGELKLIRYLGPKRNIEEPEMIDPPAIDDTIEENSIPVDETQ